MTDHTVFDILFAADMFLLPGLKRQCANTLCKYLDEDNIVSILRTARLFDLSRLEDQCAEYIAANLDKVSEKSESYHNRIFKVFLLLLLADSAVLYFC